MNEMLRPEQIRRWLLFFGIVRWTVAEKQREPLWKVKGQNLKLWFSMSKSTEGCNPFVPEVQEVANVLLGSRDKVLGRLRAAAIAQLNVVATFSTGYFLSQKAQEPEAASLLFPSGMNLGKEKKAMRLTRHNGRAGKNGVYNPKHNDRSFDVANSEHIDAERVKNDIYWDCYNGFRTLDVGSQDEELKDTFADVEQLYYRIHYQDHVDKQNERNEKARHPERNRTTDHIRLNKKTCPEETVYQIGTMEEHVTAEVLVPIITEHIAEIQKRFGSHIHVLDWALHDDEETPHIHERHVFDCENENGELFPQQEKALEALGFELPDPTKKAGRYNNRKMVFDEVCRVLLFDICKAHGLTLEEEPAYGGRAYLEKLDYIRMKQQEQIREQEITIQNQQEKISSGEEKLAQQGELFLSNSRRIFSQGELIEEQEQKLDELGMKIADVDALIDEVADIAYDKAVEAITDEVILQTHQEDISLVEGSKRWIQDPQRKASKKEKEYALKRLDGVIAKIKKQMSSTLDKIKQRLLKPEVKKQVLDEVKQTARPSITARLHKATEDAAKYNAERKTKVKKQNMEL